MNLKIALQAQNLTKKFNITNGFFKHIGEVTAVNSIDFTIFTGESVAFLGPNGAGKSTTIKMLCGILSPTSGNCKVMDFDAGHKKANQHLGLVFGTRSQLWMHMTIQQSLEMMAEIYRVPNNQKLKRISELAEAFEIKQHLNTRARTLSLGERMRCEIVAALVHKPTILLADEPTIGLDIVVRNKLRKMLREWQKFEGTTLLLTSHDMNDVEELCDRCILINKGEKKYDGSLNGIKGNLESIRRVAVTFAHTDELSPILNNHLVHLIRTENSIHHYEFNLNKISATQALTQIINHYSEKILDLRMENIELEEVLASQFGVQSQPHLRLNPEA
jgi:ABC-2 type transport system ATP-binding protein